MVFMMARDGETFRKPQANDATWGGTSVPFSNNGNRAGRWWLMMGGGVW